MAKSSAKVTKIHANPVAESLQHLLKDTYALFLLTHNYHWNVEGQQFVSLHTLFEQQYTEMFAAIDEIAERIRALDAYALPDHYAEMLQAVKNLSNPLNKETDKDKTADRMIANLIALHESVVKSSQAAKKAAVKAGDDESQDMAIGRIQVHQKSLWMLKAIVK